VFFVVGDAAAHDGLGGELVEGFGVEVQGVHGGLRGGGHR
jgi:hypothetical protein